MPHATLLYYSFSNFMTFFQVDISNQKQMLTFKDQLQSLPSVAGIVHTAMVLRDQFIKDLTFQSFSEVMAPKVKGKINMFNDLRNIIFGEIRANCWRSSIVLVEVEISLVLPC